MQFQQACVARHDNCKSNFTSQGNDKATCILLQHLVITMNDLSKCTAETLSKYQEVILSNSRKSDSLAEQNMYLHNASSN